MGFFGRILSQLADAATEQETAETKVEVVLDDVGDAGRFADRVEHLAEVPDPGYDVSWGVLPVRCAMYTVERRLSVNAATGEVKADSKTYYGDREMVDGVYGTIYGLEVLVNGIGLPRRFITPVNALRAVPCGEEPPSRTGTVQFRFAPPTKAGKAPRNALRVDVFALEPGTAHDDGAIWHIDFTATGEVAKADAHYWEGGACHSFRLRSKGTPLRVEWAGIILPSGKRKTLYEPEVR